MRFHSLAGLTLLLNGCIIAPYFMQPQEEGESTPWFEDDDPDPSVPSDGTGSSGGTFDAFAVFIGAHAAQYGDGPEGYYLFPDDTTSFQEPYITFMFVEEEYFDNYNGAAHSCRWEGTLSALGDVDLNVPNLWYSYELEVELLSTDCENFDEREWGESTPTTRIEELPLAIGYGPMSSDMRYALREVVQSMGVPWDEYDPYVFSTWFGFGDGRGSWSAEEVDPTFAIELDPDGGMVYDGTGDTVKVEMTGDPPEGLYTSEAWWGFYASDISG